MALLCQSQGLANQFRGVEWEQLIEASEMLLTITRASFPKFLHRAVVAYGRYDIVQHLSARRVHLYTATGDKRRL